MKRQIIRALVIAGVVLFIGATATAGWAWHRGYRVYSVRTGSMEPAYHTGDANALKSLHASRTACA